MKKHLKKLFGWSAILLTIGSSLYIASLPTETLLRFIGTDNVYIFMYLLAFIGSISTFASIPYPLFVISLAAGGFSPVSVGLSSAFGVLTADTLTFYSVKKGKALMSTKLLRAIDGLEKYVKKYPRALTPGLFFYGVFAPLSNDFAVISLSAMNYKYSKVIPPLALGNIIYNIVLAYLGVYAYDWIVGLI